MIFSICDQAQKGQRGSGLSVWHCASGRSVLGWVLGSRATLGCWAGLGTTNVGLAGAGNLARDCGDGIRQQYASCLIAFNPPSPVPLPLNTWLWVWERNCMRGVPSHVVCLWRLCGAGAIVMILEPWKLLYIKFRLLRPAPPLLLSTHIPGWGRTTSISTISCDCVHFISEGLVTSCKHLALISAGWRRIAWQGNSFLHKSGVLISKFRCARVCWNKKVGLQP